MAALTAGKIAQVMFEENLMTWEKQDKMIDLVSFFEPSASDMQNSGNFVWRTVEQHSPILDGWDLSGQEQAIIEETYPAVLGTPKNDLVSQRADDLRDEQFWRRRGEASAKAQVTELNRAIANAMAIQGSMFYRSNDTSGFNFVSEAQTIMNERQGYNSGERNFLLNNRDTKLFAEDLAGRQTLQGRPEATWKSGQIGQNVAEFDIYTGSFLPNITGGADPATTVTGDQSFAPEGGSIDATTGVVTNVDYRNAPIAVADSSGYSVGDKVSFSNGGTAVNAVGLADKTDTGQAMTFTIKAIPDGTSVTVSPKPIALDDPALTATEAAYANVDTQILNGATMDRLNIDATNRTNLFWDKDAVEVLGGTIPAELFKQFDGMKVINERMPNGQEMYMVYDANMIDMQFRYRLFTWYGITIKDPSRVGVSVTF